MPFKVIRYTYLLLLFLIVSGIANGQGRNSDTIVVITDTTNLDALFKKARDYSFDGNYAQARRICQKILEKKPTYYDVRTFLGRTYAWEKQYDNARTELSRVLIERENDFEALSALFDVEFWTESYSVASDYLKVALGYYPTSEALLLKKARLQIKMEEKDEAALTLRRILDLNPGQKEAIQIMNTLEGRKLNNNFQTGYLVDLFGGYSRKTPQQQFTAEYGRTFSFGSLTARGYFADRFHHKGIAGELESYVHLTKTTYADLALLYSTSETYVQRRYIAEAYQKLPAGFELSFGIRKMDFEASNVLVYTGSLGNYYKDYWFNVRAFVTPKYARLLTTVDFGKTSLTYIVSIRTYFGDSDNFLGIKAGKGRSPDEGQNVDYTVFLNSYQGTVEWQKRAFANWLVKVDFTYAKENFSQEDFTRRYTTNLTLKTVF